MHGTAFEVKCLSAIDAIAAVYRADPARRRVEGDCSASDRHARAWAAARAASRTQGHHFSDWRRRERHSAFCGADHRSIDL